MHGPGRRAARRRHRRGRPGRRRRADRVVAPRGARGRPPGCRRPAAATRRGWGGCAPSTIGRRRGRRPRRPGPRRAPSRRPDGVRRRPLAAAVARRTRGRRHRPGCFAPHPLSTLHRPVALTRHCEKCRRWRRSRQRAGTLASARRWAGWSVRWPRDRRPGPRDHSRRPPRAPRRQDPPRRRIHRSGGNRAAAVPRRLLPAGDGRRGGAPARRWSCATAMDDRFVDPHRGARRRRPRAPPTPGAGDRRR